MSRRAPRVDGQTARPTRNPPLGDGRGQANVVGVAILVGVTVLALGTLTASIGAVIDGNAARADARRVATDVDAALAPVEATGHRRGRVSFTEGELRPEDREVRLLNESGVVSRIDADALVFESGQHQVTFLSGAVVRGTPPGGTMSSPPPITSSRDGGALLVGVATLGDGVSAVGGSGPVTLRSRVTHDRERIGNGTYRIAVETEAPRPWRQYFEDRNATVHRRDVDGDGIASVVARYPGERETYLVVHRLHLEVADG